MKNLGTFTDEHQMPLIKPASEGVDDVGSKEGNQGESEAMDEEDEDSDDDEFDDGSDEDGKGKQKNVKKSKNS